VKIEVGHAEARLVGATPTTLKVVRHFVAYRAQTLPPVEAQKVIRAFARDFRGPTASMMLALWDDPATSAALTNCGLAPETLTRAEVEASLRGRGFWDGWERLVRTDGSFASGLVNHVQRALVLRVGVAPAKVVDCRGPAPRGTPLPGPDLLPFQRDALSAWLAAGQGVVDLPPRAGKTRIAVAAVCALGLPTLYVVPTVGLVKQTAEVFRAAGVSVAEVSGGRLPPARAREAARALVWVATPQSAVKVPGIGGRQVLILDEFHHAAASTWQAVVQAASGAWWRLGLTGTHYRADGRDLELVGVLSDAVYRRSVAELVALGRLVPAKIAMLRISGAVEGSGHALYTVGMVEHPGRLRALTSAANRLVAARKRVLVITKEVRHAEELSARIPGSVQVDGRDNDAVDAALRDLADGKIKCVVGTSVIGEGRDVPACDALVLAGGGVSRVKVKQDYFRALTASPGKRHALIVDTADCQHPALARQSAERLRLYESERCFDVKVIDPPAFARWLEDSDGR
jgi:superfamily II DNA or RNA helicase